MRADAVASPGGAPTSLRGADDVARRALLFGRRAESSARVRVVDGAPALLATSRGRLVTVMTFAVADAIEIVADPRRLARVSAM